MDYFISRFHTDSYISLLPPRRSTEWGCRLRTAEMRGVDDEVDSIGKEQG
jgi:hypothetical protein